MKHSDFGICPDCDGKCDNGYFEMFKGYVWVECKVCAGSGITGTDHEKVNFPDGYEYWKDWGSSVRLIRKPHQNLPEFVNIYCESKIGHQQEFTCDVCGGNSLICTFDKYKECPCLKNTSCVAEWDMLCPSCKGSPTITGEIWKIEYEKKDGEHTFKRYWRNVK